MWLPVPNPALLVDSNTARWLVRAMRSAVRSFVPSRPQYPSAAFADMADLAPNWSASSLPARPWEWLAASFAAAGGLWFIAPDAAARHLILTWENARHSGRWWTLILFHLSHGGSILRLSRTVAACNYLAPLLLQHEVLSLSGLYGVVLTACAMSTALGVLVLARRNVFVGVRGGASALEINGGGGICYALLVTACLDVQSGRPGATEAAAMWKVRPFQLLMLNIAFDAMFLAGQQRIADYTAHTGAALGAWLYCSLNQLK
jgi:hypothetical protein